jgi:hypothetical protein
MTSRQRAHILLIAGLVFTIVAASQAQQYSMKPLGVGMWYDVATPKINNSGQVIGNLSSGGFLYSGGSLTSLPSGFRPLDINNHGVIAMYSLSTSDAYLSAPPYTSQVDVGTLFGCGYVGSNLITGVNDSGTAVGIANDPTSCPQPFIFSNGQITALGGTQPDARWMAINNSNQIVGYWQDMTTPPYSIRAVELINGTLTDLDPSNLAAYDSEAQAINDAGEFVVNSNEAFCTKRLGPPSFKTITVACRGTNWFPVVHSGSTVTTLPVLGPYGGMAAAIDYWGDVVGTSQTSTGAYHGFINLYGATFDLNSHPITNGAGWTIQQAYDINDNGQIVALGVDASGKQDIVVLTPQVVKQPPPVSIKVSSSSPQRDVVGSNASVGTVTLASAAPFGGTIVFLSSSNPLVKVPPMIRVAPKSTSATFKITTKDRVGSVDITIFATTGATTKTATLTITDAATN